MAKNPAAKDSRSPLTLNPFLHRTDIRQTFVQKCISQPSDVRLGQFKVRRTLVCVLWTCILIFVTWSDSPLPVWQSPWPNVVLTNDSILGIFDRNGSILTTCLFCSSYWRRVCLFCLFFQSLCKFQLLKQIVSASVTRAKKVFFV